MSATRFTRSTQARASSYDEAAHTVELVWTTGAVVRRRDWGGGEWDEVLPLAAADLGRLQNGAQLFTDHASHTVKSAIGRVERVWADGENGLALVRLSRAAGDADAVSKVIDGITGNVSVGYAVNGWDVTRSADGVETRTARSWEPVELSIVGVPADAGAHVRSMEHRNMDDAKKIMAAIVAMAGDDLPLSKAYAQVGKLAKISPEQVKAFATGTAEPTPDELTALAAALALPVKLADGPAPDAEYVPPADPTAEIPLKTEEPKMSDEIARAVAVENSRATTILALATRHGFADQAPKWISEGKSLNAVREAILNCQADGDDKCGVHAQVCVTSDARDVRGEALKNAILNRVDPVGNPLRDDARQYRGRSAIEGFRAYMEAQGVPGVRDLSATEVGKLALSRAAYAQRAGGMTSSDLPLLLAAVSNKSLLQGFAEYSPIYPMIAARTDAPDFNPRKAILASTFPALLEVAEGADYQPGSLSESQESITPKRYARKIRMSVEMLTKDDLSGLTRAPQTYGRRVQMNRDALALAVLTANGALSDSVALFHASHGNLAAGGDVGVPSIAALAAGRAAMGIQDDLDGIILSLEPMVWLVPKAQENAALQVVAGQFVPTASSGAPLPWMRNLKVISHGTLDASSTTAHYMFADPADAPVLQWCEVSGNGPTLDSQYDWDSDALEMKVIDSFGVGAVDFRGGYKNAGV